MSTTAPATPRSVSVSGLVKRYGDTTALSGLDLDVSGGEILGIVGPNGAGKSTFVKILAGDEVATSGEIHVNGQDWRRGVDADRIAVVHQEPQLFPNLTVAENLVVGREISTFGWGKLRDLDKKVLSDTGLLPYMNRTLGDLSISLQQRTEIARALVRSADVFLFDEPNSALTEDESEQLFAYMHSLADAGSVVILVTHRLAELVRHADRAVVIIDGRCRRELSGADLTAETLARELVVRSSDETADESVRERRDAGEMPSLLSVSELSHQQDKFRSVSFELHRGEVVALVGVEGSGAREIVRAVSGLEHLRPTGGMTWAADSSADSNRTVAFVTADRSDSLFGNLSVGENLVIRSGDDIKSRFGLVRSKEVRRLAQQAREEFAVKTASLDTPIRSLSGGNQQKVAIASVLRLFPAVAALEEPTRGVDVSSKREIYSLLRQYCDGGGCALLFCTEDSEVFDVADRVLVAARGQIVTELNCADFDSAEGLAEATASLMGGSATPAAAD